MLKRRNQGGFTLVELMIGLIVGLIVLSAVLYAFISTLRSSRDVLNGTRVNLEMSTISSLISSELRRSGYWPVSGAGDSPFSTSNPDINVLDSGNCILYSYYNDSVSGAEAQIYRGFSRVDDEIRYGNATSALNDCSVATGWGALSPSDLISITAFNVSVASLSIGSLTAREVLFSITAKHANDPNWSAQWSDTVNLPNDLE
ncbi:MAG: prepilin-type N-terminal cleavage/methylation domain-containing protein [Gammaproteobacteria bacterium]|nr:prepilin-type N-terminal cleavage/methylation domain-containing protein [Gammaproteobacteria bacterium]